jgi:hypothetical protein
LVFFYWFAVPAPNFPGAVITIFIIIQLWHPIGFAVPFGRNVFQWWHILKNKPVKIRNGTGIPTRLQSWIAKKVMTVFGNTETGTASKKNSKTWERPARKKKKVWGKPWDEK